MVRRHTLLVCASAALAVGLLSSGPLRAERLENVSMVVARASITSGELQRHVDVLADDTFEGREAGSRGGRAAAGYLVKHLQDHGLVGGGTGGSFVQDFGAGFRNILARLEGSDPELRRETIVIGAHYDHVGYGTQRNSNGPTGYIHNGADDNASGVAGLLELVDALTQLPEPPRRSILFALWDGEEKGLLGSQHWLANPTLDRDQIVLAVNLDMIGRLDRERVEVYGTRTGFGFRQLVARENADAELDLEFTWELQANSDHHPFYQANIPVLMLHTGLHGDYHRPSDDAEKVNAAGMQRVVHLLFNVIYRAAEEDQRPRFRSQSRSEGMAQRAILELPLPQIPSRLGIAWQADGDSGPGIVVARVTPGSAAERAGVKPGDRLLEFDGLTVTDEKAFRLHVLAAVSPVKVRLQRADSDPPVALELTLDGAPMRLGVSWREDDADPGVLVVARVVPGSPAFYAGLQVGDRIQSLGEQSFADGQEFQRLVNAQAGSFALGIERRGRLRMLKVEPYGADRVALERPTR